MKYTVVKSRRQVASALAAAALLATPLRAQVPARPQAGAAAQGVNEEWRLRGLQMLAAMRDELRKNYFDSTFRGIDMLGAKYAKAEAAVQAAPSLPVMMGAIATYMGELDDSHTRFLPPSKRAIIDYGFSVRLIGDSAYISRVKKNSDADAKGVRRGDRVLAWDVFSISRNNWDTIRYVYLELNPRPGVQLRLRSPDGTERTVIAMSKITQTEQTLDFTDQNSVNRWIQRSDDEPGEALHTYASIGGDTGVFYWKMRSFEYGNDDQIDELMKRAKKHRAMVFDLRGNGGGAIDLLLYLIGKFTDKPLTVGRVYKRREVGADTAMIAKPTSRQPYQGRVVILLDSESASSSEIFARTLQLTGRAIVVGDRSAGAVVGARVFPREVGAGYAEGRVVGYAAYVSVSDVILPDGKRLEKAGVIPDHLVLPTSSDLAARRDPQLAKALELLGVTMSSADATRGGR